MKQDKRRMKIPTNREDEFYYNENKSWDDCTHVAPNGNFKKISHAEVVDKPFNLSQKIWKDDCSCGCEHINTFHIKEFIRLLEDYSEEINGKSYIQISKMQKFAGEKLNGKY